MAQTDKSNEMLEILFQLRSIDSTLIEETVLCLPKNSTAADLSNFASQHFRIFISPHNWTLQRFYKKFNRFISVNSALDATVLHDGDIFQAILIKTNKFNITSVSSHADESLITPGKYPSPVTGNTLASVGEETSSAISTPVCSPERSKTFPRYENVSELSNQTSSSVEDSHFSTPATNKQELASFVSTGTQPPPRPEAPQYAHSKSMPTGLLLSNERPVPHYNRMESIDPITRDVERRMSMKGSAYCISDYDDASRCDSQLATHSNVNHAKSFLRSYSSVATGFLRGAFEKAKSIVSSNNNPKVLEPKEEDEEISESDEGTVSVSDHIPPSLPSSNIPEVICRPKNSKKGPFDFDQLRVVQELDKEHTGAIWCIKFSVCGRLLATAGADNIVRVWVLKSYLNHFTKLRERYNRQHFRGGGIESLQKTMQELENAFKLSDEKKSNENEGDDSGPNSVRKTPDDIPCSSNTPLTESSSSTSSSTVMSPKPFCVYRGHTAHVLDLCWSPRNYFILSSGMDCTVKLWHLTRSECLCCFQHMDFVTCVAFMPKDDRYFISGSLDGKIRLWHIPEKKVALWNEVEQVKFITAITFVRNGKFVVVGTYNGRCFFYSTDQLKYHTVIDVRSSRGKNAKGHKITALAVHGDKLLVTSNDSRIRMYDLRDMNLTCKFKGAVLENSHIRASFSPDGKHIISGSEDNFIYVWKTGDMPQSLSVRKDRNSTWERVRTHNAVVTAAVFAPKPHLFLSLLEEQQRQLNANFSNNYVTPVNPALNNMPNSAITHAIKRPDSLLNEKVERSLTIGSTHSALSTAHLPTVSDLPLTSGGWKLEQGGTMGSTGTNGSKDRQIQGDIIVSADLTGCIKILANPTRVTTGSSHFFQTDL
uniref:WD repeat-containing protein 44 n=1 Tax=Acrobeloides nanus TaxID=290746 RepID=A0A914DNZ7_9BILA